MTTTTAFNFRCSLLVTLYYTDVTFYFWVFLMPIVIKGCLLMSDLLFWWNVICECLFEILFKMS